MLPGFKKWNNKKDYSRKEKIILVFSWITSLSLVMLVLSSFVYNQIYSDFYLKRDFLNAEKLINNKLILKRKLFGKNSLINIREEFYLASIFSNEAKFDKAIIIYKALMLQKQNASLFPYLLPEFNKRKLSNQYMEMGKYLDAKALFADSTHNTKDALFLLEILIESGEYVNAQRNIVQIEQRINKNSDDYIFFKILTSRYFLYIHKTNESINILSNEILPLISKIKYQEFYLDLAYEILAKAYLETGNYKKAKLYAQKLIILREKHNCESPLYISRAYILYSNLLRRMGENKQAQVALRSALALQNTPGVFYSKELVCTYFYLNKPEKAVEMASKIRGESFQLNTLGKVNIYCNKRYGGF